MEIATENRLEIVSEVRTVKCPPPTSEKQHARVFVQCLFHNGHWFGGKLFHRGKKVSQPHRLHQAVLIKKFDRTLGSSLPFAKQAKKSPKKSTTRGTNTTEVGGQVLEVSVNHSPGGSPLSNAWHRSMDVPLTQGACQ